MVERESIRASSINETLNHLHENDDYSVEDSMLPSTSPFRGVTVLKGPNDSAKIIFLTICLAGLQFTWTVEMAYGTPYLLDLGLSKAYMSLVWIAGPLSGLLMQPIVGVISDGWTSRWGRRRPFLLGGSVIVVISLFVIGWTKELTNLFIGETEGDTFKKVSIFLAIVAIYILDFSVNCVQASCRALIVDSLPPSQQEDGTAWAGRMVGLGNVAGYFMGYANLVQIFSFFGDTQLKVLCVFASIALIVCDIITCYAVREKVLLKPIEKSNKSPFAFFSDIFHNVWNLPTPIQRICNVQFFAWIGWFPFLFYSTTWVAEIYKKSEAEEGGSVGDKMTQGTRAGSFAFLVYSLVSLSASFVLPLIVRPSMYAPDITQGRFTNITKYLRVNWLTLPRAWTISHIIFCTCMLSTFLVSDVTAAAIVIGLCGISWAISMWAPFSLLGEYVSQRDQAITEEENDDSAIDHFPNKINVVSSSMGTTDGNMYQLAPSEHDADIEMTSTSHFIGAEDPVQHQPKHCTEPAAGVLLGIHNMYVVLPQFLVTFFSSIVFKLLENKEGTTDAIGVVLRFGALMAGVAAFISLKIGRT
ncbi:MFS general substrate transporter [Backusella circina FSU 941]|nr:MFS general substrate transporter [Backusella circina FSU 941]